MANYEFTDDQEAHFTELYKSMILAAILFSVLGFLSLLQIVFLPEGIVFFVVFGITMIIFAVTFYIPTDNFRRITTTEGNDISELITGFEEINSSWTILLFILSVHIINVLIQFIIGG